MTELFWQFILDLYNDVPLEIYEGMLSVFVIGAVAILSMYGFERGWRKIYGLFVGIYFCLIYCSTVFCRPYSEQYGHNFTPFWSYISILQGGEKILLAENIMNAVVFVPVGLFLGTLFRKMMLRDIILWGLCISLSIETMQYLLCRGFSEADDVIHNSLGCLFGGGIQKIFLFCNKS